MLPKAIAWEPSPDVCQIPPPSPSSSSYLLGGFQKVLVSFSAWLHGPGRTYRRLWRGTDNDKGGEHLCLPRLACCLERFFPGLHSAWKVDYHTLWRPSKVLLEDLSS